MADDQGLKAPKEERVTEEVEQIEESEEESEEDEEEGEESEEEKPLPKLQESSLTVSVPDRSSLEAELRDQSSQSETLVVPPSIRSSKNDHDPDCRTFSQLLAGAMASPVANSTAAFSDGLDVKPMISTVHVDSSGFPMVCSPVSLDPAGFKGQFGMSHQEALASVTAQAQAQKQLQIVHPSSSAELSPTSVPQSMPSEPSPAPQEQKVPPLPQETDICTSELDCQNSDRKTKSSHMVTKTPTSDGYNWRKYGQKQVKSTESSRSYYRCTYSDCHAKKKVECCDHSGHVTEIIYKGRHNHDPPRKIRCTKARKSASAVEPDEDSETIDLPVRKLESDPSTPKKELREVTLSTPEKKRPISSASDGGAGLKTEEEHIDEPDAKRRIKDSDTEYSAPLFKTVKEPKIVVQAASDVGISGDGYRWRKYGQKMVKGNPYPRSYYKCTSAGCPVRKHVERSTDDTSAVIITYEGKHDHDMPVPKKRHGPPSAALLIAAAAAMNNAQIKKAETLPNRRASTQWSMDIDSDLAGEKALELGGEKALESARTLLSIGIELKPY